MFMFAACPKAHMLPGHEVVHWPPMQAVSPNGTFFVTGGKTGLLHRYQIPVQPQKSEASSGTKLQVSNELLRYYCKAVAVLIHVVGHIVGHIVCIGHADHIT